MILCMWIEFLVNVKRHTSLFRFRFLNYCWIISKDYNYFFVTTSHLIFLAPIASRKVCFIKVRGESQHPCKRKCSCFSNASSQQVLQVTGLFDLLGCGEWCYSNIYHLYAESPSVALAEIADRFQLSYASRVSASAFLLEAASPNSLYVITSDLLYYVRRTLLTTA